ncbi:DNRLRE domain-containing protein [Microbispora sp. H10670]|uniref:DNRLRE domain-containing protein n=1 Tax=Microbispora sp. H10670 TaxID=2729108 RepID=UPI0016022F56|nr:DNRLRE domain-containing protein [Microbispora sp. H10670]
MKRRTRLTAVVTGLAMVAALLVVPPAVAVPVAKAAPASPAPVSERPDATSAALSARLQNSPVEDLSARTEDSTTVYLPDGSARTEIFAGPVRVKQNGAWTPVDTTLVERNGHLEPKAAAAGAQVEISAGGSGPLAELVTGSGKDEHRFGVRWPTSLGGPQVSGNTATWADIAPGADLVVQAQPRGFVHYVVLKRKPTAPVEIRLPVELAGADLSKDSRNRLKLVDNAGKGKGDLVAAAPPPHMWDAAAADSPDAGKRSEVGSAIEKGSDGPVLVLKPSMDFLNAPDVTYPVTIDPYMQMTLQTDTFVSDDYPNSATSATWLHVGRFGSGTKTARTYLQFKLGGLVSKHIMNADLYLSNYKANACGGVAAGLGIRVKRVTSAWSSSTLTQSNHPTSTTTGMVDNTSQAYGYDSSCPEHDMLWSIEDIVQYWTDHPAENYGLQVRAVSETQATNWRMYRSSENTVGADGPRLTIQWNSYPTVPHHLTVNPSAGGTNGGTFVTSLTPTMTGMVGDGEWDTETISFYLEHDPSYPAEGTGSVWTGSVTGILQGELGTVTVPSGKLVNGYHYRWRARGDDGTDYSRDYSSYRYFTVDMTAPAAPTISCPDYASGVWTAKASAPVTCTLDTTSADGAGYYWGLDDASAPTLVEDNDGGGDAKTITIDPAQGWHTLSVKARDMALRTSTVTTYSFGAGAGEVTAPLAGDRTQAAVTLGSRAAPGATGVRYEYKADVSGSGTWAAIPTTHVTVPGSATPISGWPYTTVTTGTSAVFGSLYWDVAATMAAAGRGDGPVQVRACFVKTSGEACSDAREFTLERAAFGSSYATQQLGPGEVSLLTGDYSVSATDVSAFGLSVSRGHTTLAPATASGVAGVFGPGWTASFPGGASSVSGMRFEDHSGAGYVLFTGTDGSTETYTVQSDGTYKGISDASDGSTVTKDSGTQFTHTDTEGTKTIFTASGGAWTVSSIDEAGAENTTTYTYDASGRVSRMLAPVPAGVTCTTLVAGCKTLDITYAASTTASGVSSGWGDYTGLTKSISYTAYDPTTSAMKTTTLAAYTYDSTGHLRTVTDPRTNLTFTYYYNAAGRISQITPPGLNPWRVNYDTSGRVADVQREAGATDIVQAVSYGVPINSPVDVTGATAATWSQTTDLPRTGSAVFPAWRVPPQAGDGSYTPAAADYPYAALTYMDVNGRAVNTATYGAGAWQVSATRYDDDGNTIWELSAGNRTEALTPTSSTDAYVAGRASTAERADLLADVTVYNDDGDVVSSDGPAHQAMLTDGTLVSARQHTDYTYDEGKPDPDTDYHLVTTTTVKPLVVNGAGVVAAGDTHAEKTGYDPIVSGDPSGWDLFQPTSQKTVVAGGADIIRKVRYDDAGRQVERRMPSSSGSDAGTATTTYYTAAANSTYPSCGGKPQWSGLVCRTAAAASPSGGGTLPVTTTTYGYWGQTAQTVETSGSATRTSTVTVDVAGRASQTSVTETGAGSSALPDRTYAYDSATGLRTGVTAGGVSVTTAYDALGRAYSTTDADGNTALTTFDTAGRVASVNDGKGTYTYAYDGTDAAGKAERRGVPTGIAVSTIGSFTAAFDAAGNLSKQVYPNGLTATSTWDGTGKQTGLTYAKSGTTWLAFTATPDVEGRTVETAGPNGSLQHYTYDTAGRLTKVADTYNLSCETRTYGFDVDTNRTSQASYPAADDGSCSTSTTPTTATHTFDSADRITDSGYSYDAFGRTTAVPASSTANGAAVTAGYYAGDMVRTLTQASTTKTFTLDPLGRIRQTTSSAGTQTNHYTGGGDSPAWIGEVNGSWTRNVTAFTGLSATQTSGGTLTLQLTNLHGDVIATCADNSGATGVDNYAEQTEYGLDRATNTSDRYEWLGGAQRASDTVGDIVLMGVRLYNPATGRFLQVDPVVGASANAYDYCNSDPINCRDLDGRCPNGWSWSSVACNVAVAAVDGIVETVVLAACGGATSGLGIALCHVVAVAAATGISYWVETRWDGGFTWGTLGSKLAGSVVKAALAIPGASKFLRTKWGKWLIGKIRPLANKLGSALTRAIRWALGTKAGRQVSIVMSAVVGYILSGIYSVQHANNNK